MTWLVFVLTFAPGVVVAFQPHSMPAHEMSPPLAVDLAAQEPTSAAGVTPQWGRLANPNLENRPLRTTLFFPGQARDGTTPYGIAAAPNLQLFTVHPQDDRHLNWATDPDHRVYVLQQMNQAGINVVTMSAWGEATLPPTTGWVKSAPMQVAPAAQDELFAAAVQQQMLVMPLIESRGDWAFRDEFPRDREGRIAPGTVSQIVDLIGRYLQSPDHPEWARQWARLYDRNGKPRYAIVVIHASSNPLGETQHAEFAAGFQLLADEIFARTKIEVGFLLDVLPRHTHAPGRFKASPEMTGPHLAKVDSILGLQCFLPEVWIGDCLEADRIQWKRGFTERWFRTKIPLVVDVAPGYDNHLVFPKTKLKYGFSEPWQTALKDMVQDFGRNGMVFNSWNGYTEGMAAVATKQHGDLYFRWLQELMRIID